MPSAIIPNAELIITNKNKGQLKEYLRLNSRNPTIITARTEMKLIRSFVKVLPTINVVLLTGDEIILLSIALRL
jgi:hypothetical protein